jgi:hypothetical protein
MDEFTIKVWCYVGGLPGALIDIANAIDEMSKHGTIYLVENLEDDAHSQWTVERVVRDE